MIKPYYNLVLEAMPLLLPKDTQLAAQVIWVEMYSSMSSEDKLCGLQQQPACMIYCCNSGTHLMGATNHFLDWF